MASKTGKVVLVTGSSTGFGRLIVEHLASEGHTVFASMRNTKDKNQETAEELLELARDKKLSIQVLDLDVTDEASVERGVATIIETTGRIDAVVNNAGVGSAGLTEAHTIAQAKRMFDVNLFGVLRVNRAVLPTMRSQGNGLLIHVTSTLGRISMPFLGIYAASKFALEGLAESYRFELQPIGIDSVIVEPGAYPTNFFQNMESAEDQEILESYGDMAAEPEKMFAGIGELFQSDDAPNPEDVAQAVGNLIVTPFGQRPVRTVVDSLTGQHVKDLNTCADTSTQGVMKAFGN
jgi:NAD(P)-dependent dehydrogenase (short-subunit alcohol dehydrogenase family)